MIKIKIPDNNSNERLYILDILFKEFLGLDYEIISESDNKNKDWEIIIENGNKVIFKDAFFNNYLKENEYLNINSIPKNILFQNKKVNKYLAEDNIPILYGDSYLKFIKNNKYEKIICGIDIFASSFFMLSRWEEFVVKNRDFHNRFPVHESLAFKFSFLDRPIVNEYCEMLKNMLLSIGLKQNLKSRNFSLLVTHDIDIPLKFRNIIYDLKNILIDVIRKKNIYLIFTELSAKIRIVLNLEKDPYNSFDYIMNLSEKNNYKSYFFLMGKGLTKYDNLYKSNETFVIKLVKEIKKRNHYIGIHPSYNAYNNSTQFNNEKNELEKNFKTKLFFGREHYLRFEIPTTWQIWEDNNMEWDSSLTFPEKEGFRCGVCYEYSVFNILSRMKLNLKEKPLIVMEASFLSYQPNITPKEMEFKIISLMNTVKKYNGEFVILWHNNNFFTENWIKFNKIYEKILNG